MTINKNNQSINQPSPCPNANPTKSKALLMDQYTIIFTSDLRALFLIMGRATGPNAETDRTMANMTTRELNKTKCITDREEFLE